MPALDPEPGGAFVGANLAAAPRKEEEEEVTRAEDLMREHGILKRVAAIEKDLGIYDLAQFTPR